MQDIQKAMTDVTQSPVKNTVGMRSSAHIAEVYDFATSFPTVRRLAAEDPRTLKKLRTARHSARISISFRQSCRQWKAQTRHAFPELDRHVDKLGSFRERSVRADQGQNARYGKKGNRQLQKLAGDAEDQKFTEEIAATTGTVVHSVSGRAIVRENIQREKGEKTCSISVILSRHGLATIFNGAGRRYIRRTETAKLVSSALTRS